MPSGRRRWTLTAKINNKNNLLGYKLRHRLLENDGVYCIVIFPLYLSLSDTIMHRERNLEKVIHEKVRPPSYTDQMGGEKNPNKQ